MQMQLVRRTMKIIIDSREQRALTFRKSGSVKETIVKKLDVGDYSIEGYEDKIALDRKSAIDLYGTLGKGHKRFKRELERAKDYDYFGIIIEDNFRNIYTKNFDNAHFSRMRGDVIIKILMALKLRYNVDVIFCNSREEATSYIRQIFNAYLKMQEVNKSERYNSLSSGEKPTSNSK